MGSSTSFLTYKGTLAALPELILVSEVKYSKQSETFMITCKAY